MKQAVKSSATLAPSTQHSVIMRHLQAFRENNLQSVMEDYSDSAVFITQQTTYTGKTAIRGFFEELIIHFPPDHTNFTLHTLAACNNMVLIIWEASTPTLSVMMGTDTFILSEGKIVQQTFAAHMNYH